MSTTTMRGNKPVVAGVDVTGWFRYLVFFAQIVRVEIVLFFSTFPASIPQVCAICQAGFCGWVCNCSLLGGNSL
jgi:hypothetical protein